MTLNDFLKTGDPLLTLTNEQGEKFEAGKADYVKSLKTKVVMRWKVKPEYKNVFPFTYAILHSAQKVFDVRFIKPILPNTETTVEMVY